MIDQLSITHDGLNQGFGPRPPRAARRRSLALTTERPAGRPPRGRYCHLRRPHHRGRRTLRRSRRRRGDPARRGQQGLPRRHRRRRGARPDLRRRGADRAGRPVGLRQDDHDEDDQPAHRAEHRAHPARRRGRHPGRPGPAAPPDRLRHPERRALPAPDGAHQRRHRAPAARLGQAAHPRPGRRAARPRRPRPGRLRRPLSRTSSPAGSASAPAWPARWPPTRRCC